MLAGLQTFTLLGKGALSMAIATAKQAGLRGLVVPAENANEAAVVEEIDVTPVANLAQAVAFFSGEIKIPPHPSRLEELFEQYSAYDVDFGDVRGQETAKRAIMRAGQPRFAGTLSIPPGHACRCPRVVEFEAI